MGSWLPSAVSQHAKSDHFTTSSYEKQMEHPCCIPQEKVGSSIAKIEQSRDLPTESHRMAFGK